MNQKIKELSIQAGEEVDRTFILYPGEDRESKWHDALVEEFAKLIVEECVDMAEYREGDELYRHFGIICRSRF